MKKYEYALRMVWCKEQEDVDRVLNEEVYKMNAPEDIVSLNVLPVFDPSSRLGTFLPIGYYVSYVYRWEV